MWNILSLQLKASIASWKLERIFRCGFRFQCCIKLCTRSQLNCWRYQGWEILLNFTKDRRQFVLVEKSSWGCYHLDPAGVSLKGLPFSITWVVDIVHCGHCLCLSFLTSSSKLLYFTFVLFPQGSRCWERNKVEGGRVKNGSLNIVSNAITGLRVGWGFVHWKSQF